MTRDRNPPSVPRVIGALATCAVLVLGPGISLAHADALVSVQLNDAHGKPADGKVELAKADGEVVASCETHGGRCEIKGAPGGLLTVTVQPKKGTAPKARKVMIPPSGKVSLVVAASN